MKRYLILAICLITILCTSSVFAASKFADVKNTKYEKPVEMLITLGLVNGYEDGTYRPENIVTRAEMAKLMVIGLGKEGEVDKAKLQTSNFSDVQQTDWEYAYVNVAANNGIINGYPDGTFGPKKTVSYAEATAMIVRALGYEQAVAQEKDVWPTNYINQARKLSLYNSIGTVSASDGAKRGNISILLWNMLRTGVGTITSENASGVVYSQGEKMINKYLSNFTYLQEATVTSVKFSGDDSYDTATIKFEGEKNISVTMNGLEAAKMYGQKYEVLYNKKTKKIESLNDSAENDVKTGEIKKLTSDRIYLEGGSSNGYKLPKSTNILLYGIEDIDYAVNATVVFDGSTPAYVVAFAPDKVYLALVTDTNITVSKKDGIEVMNYKASSSKKYALTEDEKMPDEGDIILYYLNSNTELVILKKTDLTNSKVITSATSKKIKIGSTTYTLEDAAQYQIAMVSGDKLKAMNASAIEDDEDSACYFSFGGVQYFVVYVGGTDAAEKEIAAELKTAKSNLNTMITKAKKISEVQYTQATYSAMANALATAETVYNTSSSTVTNVKSAYNDLKAKYDALVKISTLSTEKKREAETEIVTAKAKLRTLVNSSAVTTAVKNKSTYTTASYNAFNTALITANSVLSKTNATLINIESAEEKLDDMLKALVKNTDDADRKNAISALNTALTNASKVGKATEYTSESYANFKAIWDEAKALNTSKATIAEINDMTTRLNNAIKLLSTNVDTQMTELNAALLEAETLAKNKDVYTTASYQVLVTAIDNAQKEKANANATATSLENVTTALNKAIKALVKVDDELTAQKKAANSRVGKIATLLEMPESTHAEKEEKIEALKKAISEENATLKTAKTNLEKKINEAKALTESDWNTLGYTNSYENMKKALSEAEATLQIINVTSEEVLTAFKSLNEAIK